MGFEPTISTVTGWHVNRYTTGPHAPITMIGDPLILFAAFWAVNRRSATRARLDIMLFSY